MGRVVKKGKTKLSEEHKKRLSEAHKGKKLSEEHKQNISKANTGRKFSEATKRKIAESNRGKKRTTEQKQNISKARKGTPSPLKGKKLSEEHKKRLSEAHMGQGKGRKRSEETVRKVAESNRGKKRTTEQKQNISKATKIAMARPGMRERISKATKIAMARPEVREKMEKAGKMIKKGERRGIKTEFKKGQIPLNKGVKASDELKKKLSIAQQKRYDKMSKEERKAIGKWNIGRKPTLEAKKNMSIAQTKRTDRLRPEYRKKLALARRNVKIPKTDTKPEKFLQKLLRENNIIFETHKAILGQPDIFIKPNFCIFMDGDRYHANPKKYSDDKIIWNEYNRKGRHIPAQTAKMIREKDKRITDNLKKEGFKVIRFWQSELEEETEKCLKKIRRFTKSS